MTALGGWFHGSIRCKKRVRRCDGSRWLVSWFDQMQEESEEV